jgi:hypothetical protein
MGLRCVLWDFGDTLVDERWMRRAPPGVPEWSDVWSGVVSGALADRWNLGEATFEDVVDAVAPRLPMSRAEVLVHARRCCEQIAFFAAPMAIARASSLPQAIVTVNPDAFTSVIVPRYALDATFVPIVTSWQEHTLDKAELADIALHRIGDFEREDALLIDNIEANVVAWRARSGRGYRFRGEHRFRADLHGALRDLAATTRS